jgi:hypothetical protein
MPFQIVGRYVQGGISKFVYDGGTSILEKKDGGIFYG